jgi:predicted nucleotidyltransferase
MGTANQSDRIGEALFSKNRRALLGLLYGHAEEAFYLRQLARASGGGMGAVQRELKRLTDAGIIRRTVRGSQVYFQANPECPVFAELKGLIVKTAGVGDVLRRALASLADRVDVAFVYGSFARGDQTAGSDVDLMVIGEVAFSEIVVALAPAQEALRREVNPSVYPPGEYRAKTAAGHHFLRSLLTQPKLFLIGGERDLAEMAQKRLAE